MKEPVCSSCELSKQQPRIGQVDFACAHCCARLVMNTCYPNKQLAARMLQQIALQANAAPRHQIVAVLAELVASNSRA